MLTLSQGKAGTAVPADTLVRCKAHVLKRIREAQTDIHPFHHAFVERLFPDDFYAEVRRHMLQFKCSDKVSDRRQDNPAFTNRRFNLFARRDAVTDVIRGVFSDLEIRQAIARKFYVTPSPELVDAMTIHEEFEYVFTAAGRFQNIHIDIPPKLVSFVFYIPGHAVSPEEEVRNATILYDKALRPHYKAKFKANSACIFAPHFSSYHGFNSTIDRDVLVMFYVHGMEMRRWRNQRRRRHERPPYADLKDAIERKLRAHPLRAIPDPSMIEAERASCLVNAPKGRVLIDGRVLPMADT